MAYTGEGGIQDIRSRIYRERGSVTLDASGDATITFVNPVPASLSPLIHLTPSVASGASPIIANPVSGSWTTDGNGDYTGVSIHAERAQDLPAVIVLLSDLNGRRVTESASLTGTQVDWMVY